METINKLLTLLIFIYLLVLLLDAAISASSWFKAKLKEQELNCINRRGDKAIIDNLSKTIQSNKELIRSLRDRISKHELYGKLFINHSSVNDMIRQNALIRSEMTKPGVTESTWYMLNIKLEQNHLTIKNINQCSTIK